MNLVVERENKELEDDKKTILEKISRNKEILEECKNSFLNRVISCAVPLIDNPQLSDKLEDIKSQIDTKTTELETSIESMRAINESRDVYKPVSRRGALLYTDLYGLKAIDPLYQFSIESFVKLALNSIDAAKKDEIIANRTSNIVDRLTRDVIEFGSVCVYEKHSILFLFRTACTLDKDFGNLTDSELMFFIRGDVGAEKTSVKNPTTWLSNKCWREVINLSAGFESFTDLTEHVRDNIDDWKKVKNFLNSNFFLIYCFNVNRKIMRR